MGTARIALTLRGPHGVAWFVEAGERFEQLGGWNEYGAVYEANAADPMHTQASPRIDYGYGYDQNAQGDCVIMSNENGRGIRIEEPTRRRRHDLTADNASAAFVGPGTEPSSR